MYNRDQSFLDNNHRLNQTRVMDSPKQKSGANFTNRLISHQSQTRKNRNVSRDPVQNPLNRHISIKSITNDRQNQDNLRLQEPHSNQQNFTNLDLVPPMYQTLNFATDRESNYRTGGSDYRSNTITYAEPVRIQS